MNRWKGLRETLVHNPKLTKFLKVQNAAEPLLASDPPATRKDGLGRRAELTLLIEELQLMTSHLRGNDQLPELIRKLKLKLSETQNLLESTLTAAEYNYEPAEEPIAAFQRIPACPLSSALRSRLASLHPSKLFTDAPAQALAAPSEAERPQRPVLAEFAGASKELRDAIILALDCLTATKLEMAEAQLFLVTSKTAVEEQAGLVGKRIRQVAADAGMVSEGLTRAEAGLSATLKLAEEDLVPMAEDSLARALGYLTTLRNLDFETAEQVLLDWEN